MRLAKYLAHGGVASRRKAEEIIGKGLVTVGGEVVTDPARDVEAGDDVRVNGDPVTAADPVAQPGDEQDATDDGTEPREDGAGFAKGFGSVRGSAAHGYRASSSVMR